MLLDTSNIEFQKALDLGSSQTGRAIVRATLFVHDKWVDINQLSSDPAILNGGTEAGGYFARRQRDPGRAARMAKARQKLGQVLDATYGERIGLAGLRFKAGLSQVELAKRMNTQQPSVARWERFPETMRYESIESLANALGVDPVEVFAAIKAQRQPKTTVETHELA